jgi:hypothetical protein
MRGRQGHGLRSGIGRMAAGVVAGALLIGGMLSGGMLTGCGSAPEASDNPSTVTTSAPAEENAAGDIPDNQVFVAYRSETGGFELKVPEGWARTDGTNFVNFTDNLNTIQVNWLTTATPPSTERANQQDVPALRSSQPGFRLRRVVNVKMPVGITVVIDSQEDSATNSVTGKKYRLDVLRYEFFQNGKQATLMLSAPVGADNVDPWKIVSESFRWR